MMFDIEKIKLPNWGELTANQLDYYSNADRHDLICRYKLTQIYQNFYIARMHLIYSNDKINYGDLDQDELDKNDIQKIFLQNSLIYYNFCIDLSWSMAYLYCLPIKSNNNILKDEVDNAEKIVNYEFINNYLKSNSKNTVVEYRNKLKELLKIINEFWNKILSSEFRKMYNYTKHQGAYNLIGINLDDFMKIEGINTNIEIIKSPEFSKDIITNELLAFNNEFIIYMDKIIDIVIDPSNKKELYDFNEIVGNLLKNKK